MTQTKVTNVRRHNDVLITDFTLVLVQCKPEEALFWQSYNSDFPSHYRKELGLVKGIGKYLKPILISVSEKIEVGDKVYVNGAIVTAEQDCGTIGYNTDVAFRYFRKGHYKILALPEHFSLEHLQAIVEGELKNAAIECEHKYNLGGAADCGDDDLFDGSYNYYQIKLNTTNHITLFKDKVNIENNNPHGIEVGKKYWFKYLPCDSNWEVGICERITEFGHPWIGSPHNGIIFPNLYKVQEFSPNQTYTREEVLNIVLQYDSSMLSYSSPTKAIEWFEKNVK